MSVLASVLGAVVSYTAFALLASRTAGKIDSLLTAGIVNFVGAAVPLVLWVLLRARDPSSLPATPQGLILSLLAGAAISAFGVFLMKAFENGAASYVIPLVYGGTIALSSLVAWAVFREEMSIPQTAGILLILCGLAIIVFARAKGV